jgi:hypothetical protein
MRSDIPPELIEKARKRFLEFQQRERSRLARFGSVRPEIAVDFQGYKFVAVGGRLYYNKRWKFFIDFLLDYIPGLFGKDWFEAEIARAVERRHPVMQWRIDGMHFIQRQRQKADGTYEATPNGSLLAYLTFAYDVYVVEHNGRLDDRLLSRLKNSDQFQGARHELFAEATCFRAGFEIEREDETDPSARHVEFTAVHKQTGQKISVEAKSKHRPGVLGQPGTPEAQGALNLRFGKLLNDAVAKSPPYPLVVFFDTNLPLETANRVFAFQPGNPTIPSTFVLSVLDRLRKRSGGVDPINHVVYTNHPDHYVIGDDPAPRKHLLSIFSTVPRIPVAHMQALFDLHRAANLYGNIPNEFPNAGE